MAAMGQGFDATYNPDPANVAVYAKKYEKYTRLGEGVESL
jgi:L-ribulokinase